MENDTSKDTEKLLELFARLNKYIEEYREQSVLIQTLLTSDDEDSIFKIKDVLNHRETLIKNYDATALELKREQTLRADGNTIPEEIKQKISSLEQKRQAVFNSIKDIENKNFKKISDLYNDNRGRIKQIEEGKKLMNAYHSAPTATDGVFFDRRK